MRKALHAALAAVLFLMPGQAEPKADSTATDVLKNMINSPTADSWNVYGAVSGLHEDLTVQAGKAMRITVTKKGENPWDAAASDAIVKPVTKGDVILVAFWARAEEPPKGSDTVLLNSVSVGITKAPYTSFVAEPVTISGKWQMYYASGVADADYKAGQLNVGIQLASEAQVIALGPVFVLDFGPNYDRSKLPRNKTAPPIAPASMAPSALNAALATLQAKLPVKGALISDPAQAPFLFGPDLSGHAIDDTTVPGGKALRVATAKAGAHPWDDGATVALTGGIRKGDTVVLAAYLRAKDTSAQITEIGVHMSASPWTAIATASASLPANQWRLVYASGVAAADYPVDAVNAGLQLGQAQQMIDIGPIFVLNLGPSVTIEALPKNN